MSVIDTNLAIERFRSKREIHENITIITAIEFPPVLSYEKFLEEVYTITS